LAATIAEKIQLAEVCFARADYACAIEQSLVATNLDAANTRAKALLLQAQAAKTKNADADKLQQLLAEGAACLAAQDLACAQVKAREALGLAADNKAATELLAQANRQQQDQAIAALIAQAQDCLGQQDFSCTQLFIDKALALNPRHPGLERLVASLAAAQQLTQVQQREQAQKIQRWVQQAQACLGVQDYPCATAKAEQVLSVDGANAAAVDIRQRAAFAQQQAQELSAKTDRLLAQANSCMAKKNYACAIAKAESALDLDGGNSRAAAVKQKALDTQRQLKETGLKIQ
jgi:hypothetical protein